MKKQQGSRGIVEILILVVVALVIIFLIGLEPADVWSKFVLPILQKTWEIVLAVSKAIAGAIKAAV